MNECSIHRKVDQTIPSYPSLFENTVIRVSDSIPGMRIRRKCFGPFRNVLFYTFDRMFHLNISISLITFVLLALFAESTEAQNFYNTGTYQGSGKFHVRNLATGLPDTVTGIFDYFGGNQTIDARIYQNLEFHGASSIKQTNGIGLAVLQNATVAADVTLQVQASDVMTLDKLNGRLTESGVIIGRITKTVDLTTPSDSSDFGGIGLSIRSAGPALGTTKITRTSGSSPSGKNSIHRWFNISPTNVGSESGSLYFNYATDELSGQNANTIDLWRSPDGGVTWRRQRTTRNANTLLRAGKYLNGWWTAADTNNFIGRSNYEFDPDSILPPVLIH